jgi:WD40-like Beta Propeller Repeat
MTLHARLVAGIGLLAAFAPLALQGPCAARSAFLSQTQYLSASAQAAEKSPSLVVAEFRHPVSPTSRSASLELQVAPPNEPRRTLFRRFDVYFEPRMLDEVDLSQDGTWLTFVDPSFNVHLVRLSSVTDRVLGKGDRPSFSSDGKYLAFLVGEGYPISSPGIQGFLNVYRLEQGTLRAVGKAEKGPLYSEYAWSPAGHNLAWQINLLSGGKHQRRPNPNGPLWVGYASASAPAKVAITRPPGKRGDIFKSGKGADVRSDGGFAWNANGKSLLYWRWNRSKDRGTTNTWSLVCWALPDGPAKVVAKLDSAYPKDESHVPAPIVSLSGRFIASLLGGPKGAFSRLSVVSTRTHTAVATPLPGPGALLAARFNPTDDRLSLIDDISGPTSITYRLDVINVTTLRRHGYGDAYGAYWSKIPAGYPRIPRGKP